VGACGLLGRGFRAVFRDGALAARPGTHLPRREACEPTAKHRLGLKRSGLSAHASASGVSRGAVCEDGDLAGVAFRDRRQRAPPALAGTTAVMRPNLPRRATQRIGERA